jgi:hypothetical protein
MSVSHADLGISRYAGKAERAAEDVRKTGAFDKLARAGYAAKGLLYLVVGGIAARGAFSTGERPVDQRGAMEEVGHQGYGSVMLSVLGFGLAAFALYKLIEAFADPRLKGQGMKGVAKRIGRLGGAAIHGGLAYAAFDLARGNPAQKNGSEHWTARLMAQPFGPYLVAAVGIGVIAFGVAQLIRAYKTDIWKQLDTSAMGGHMRGFAKLAGRGGYAARGIVFGIAGAFLIKAALNSNPSESKGLRGALDALRDSSGGPWALGVVAIGLMAFAVYCLVRARYFRAATR